MSPGWFFSHSLGTSLPPSLLPFVLPSMLDLNHIVTIPLAHTNEIEIKRTTHVLKTRTTNKLFNLCQLFTQLFTMAFINQSLRIKEFPTSHTSARDDSSCTNPNLLLLSTTLSPRQSAERHNPFTRSSRTRLNSASVTVQDQS